MSGTQDQIKKDQAELTDKMLASNPNRALAIPEVQLSAMILVKLLERPEYWNDLMENAIPGADKMNIGQRLSVCSYMIAEEYNKTTKMFIAQVKKESEAAK